ncbi:hypothetical protein [Peptostreptococcus porci]|uniref:hypothetical protein n=1 Tax=Peptostreptococcus porci TaxID=2652282 RepID=UPI002A91086F|nr:hypothetical protein [Peptostreptococcus porci]MDY5436061.1 hypothetical protein [Peptostreptococcus porci]
MSTDNIMYNEYDYINSVIEKALYSEEKLLCLVQSSKKESYYALVENNLGRCNSFRISTHKNSMYYSNKTFSLRKIDEPTLIEEIRRYLDGNCWFIFRFTDYCALKIINFLSYNNQPIYIDDTMGIFSKEKMGILFYKLSHLRRNRYEMDTISESLQKALRKLFAAGLINGFKERNGEIRVYITSVGQYLIHKVAEENQEYYERFLEFKENSDLYSYIELPDED